MLRLQSRFVSHVLCLFSPSALFLRVHALGLLCRSDSEYSYQFLNTDHLKYSVQQTVGVHDMLTFNFSLNIEFGPVWRSPVGNFIYVCYPVLKAIPHVTDKIILIRLVIYILSSYTQWPFF